MATKQEVKKATKGIKNTINFLLLATFLSLILSFLCYLWVDPILSIKVQISLLFVFLVVKFIQFCYEKAVEVLVEEIEKKEDKPRNNTSGFRQRLEEAKESIDKKLNNYDTK